MSAGGTKRVVAEIRFGEDRAGVAKVAGRSIHQYWTLLAPHFRDVFLAPQRRSDDGGVSWTWREPAEKKALAAGELSGVRDRLERASESFEENPVSQLVSEQGGGAASSQEIIDQLTVRVKSVADGLRALPDAALAEFVCRTENDVMVHSWGLVAAAKIVYPDSLESGVGGVVMFGGKGSSGNEVVIENAKGLRVARTTTDEAGEFAFNKLQPGRYRIKVMSGPGEYSRRGVDVTVERGEMSRVELRSTDDPAADMQEQGGEDSGRISTDTRPPAGKKTRGRRIWLLLLVLVLVGGAGWWLFEYFRTDRSIAQKNVRISTLTPEDYSQSRRSTRPETGGTGMRSGSGPDSQGNGSHPDPATGVGPVGTETTSPVSKINTRIELKGVDGISIGGPEGNERTIAPQTGTTTQAQGALSTESPKTQVANGTGAATNAVVGVGSQGGSDSNTAALVKNSTGGKSAESLTGHLSAGLGASAPDSPAGREEARKLGNAQSSGAIADDKKSGESPLTSPPATGSSTGGGAAGGPVGLNEGKSGSGSGAGGTAVAGQPPRSSVTVIEKPGAKSSPPDARNENEKDKPAENAGNPQAPVVAANQDGSGPASSQSTEAADSSGSGSSGNAVAGGTGAEKASTQPEGGLANLGKPLAGVQAALPEQQPVPVSVSEIPLQARPLPPGMQVVGVVRAGGWRLRMARDMIVPTLPVAEGDKDHAGMRRRELVDEARVLLPATLRRPALQCGFLFKFTTTTKVQALRWEKEAGVVGKTSEEDGRVEIGWGAGRMPRNVRHVLVYPDGNEAARVEFDAEGRARVAVRPEIRAVIWVAARYADNENADDARLPRMAWQVLKGPLASSAWTNDSRWQDGTNCRLEMVMSGVDPAGTRIVLMDQTSGWQLVGDLD